MLKDILEWISNAIIKGLKQDILVDVAKLTTKDPGFEQAPINTSSVKRCISLATRNGFPKFVNVIVLTSV